MPTVFFSYSHKDEVFRDHLEVHLSALKRQKIIESWHDRKIIAGSAVDETIDQHLDQANVILLLISPDFIASDYCYEREVQRALQRHSQGACRVIPVILRPCDWHGLPFGKLLATPTDGRAITLWANRDEAFLDVVKSIKTAIKSLGQVAKDSAPFSPTAMTSIQEATVEDDSTENEASIGQRTSSSKTPAAGKTSSVSNGRAGTPQQLPAVGVDLGTSSIRIYIEGRGIVLDKPSVLVADTHRRQIHAIGAPALDLVFGQGNSGIRRNSLQLIRPIQESAVSDPDAAFQMLHFFLKELEVHPGSRVMFSVPEAATTANLKVMFDIAKRAKFGKVEFAPRALLASVSEGTSHSPLHNGWVVDLGAGTTEIAVISDSRVHYSRSIRLGGIQIDGAIAKFMRRAYNHLFGERTGESIKIQIGSAWPLGKKESMAVAGRNAIAGWPTTKVVDSDEVRAKIQECLEPLVSTILEIRDRGLNISFFGTKDENVVLCGGGALTRGIAEFLENRLQTRILVQKDPLRSVASGFGPLLKSGWKPTRELIYPPRRLRPCAVPISKVEISKPSNH